MIRRSLLLLLAFLSFLMPTAAQAQWSASGAGVAELRASTMTNATDLTAACATGRPKSDVLLTWTRSPDAYVDGYVITRTGSGGGTDAVITVQGNLSSATDTPPARSGYSYAYAIRATGKSWTTPLGAATAGPTYTRNSCTTA